MSEASEGTWGCRRQDNGRARFENAGHASASLQAHGQPQRVTSYGGPCCHLCAWRACLIAVVPPRSTTGRGRGRKRKLYICAQGGPACTARGAHSPWRGTCGSTSPASTCPGFGGRYSLGAGVGSKARCEAHGHALSVHVPMCVPRRCRGAHAPMRGTRRSFLGLAPPCCARYHIIVHVSHTRNTIPCALNLAGPHLSPSPLPQVSAAPVSTYGLLHRLQHLPKKQQQPLP